MERTAHAHDVAAAGQPLMKIQGTGDLKVELIMPSNWLTWVKPGTPFDFAIDETGGSVTGRIARLGAAIDPVSKTMRVTGSIAVQGTVLPGMSGTAHFARSWHDVRAQRPDQADPRRRHRARPARPGASCSAGKRRCGVSRACPNCSTSSPTKAAALIAYDQAFVLKRPLAGDGWQVEAASSLARSTATRR